MEACNCIAEISIIPQYITPKTSTSISQPVTGRPHQRTTILSRGSPSFIVPITKDANLCFDWKGEEGKIYNFFFNPDTGLSINGILEKVDDGFPNQEDVSKDNMFTTGLTKVAVLIPQNRLYFTVDQNLLVIQSSDDHAMLKLPMNTSSSTLLQMNGITFKLDSSADGASKLQLELKGFQISIFVTRGTHYHQQSNIELHIEKKSSQYTFNEGIFGQFLQPGISVVSTDHGHFMKKGDRYQRVYYQTIRRGGILNDMCWYTSNPAKLSKRNQSRYYLNDLFTIPTYK